MLEAIEWATSRYPHALACTEELLRVPLRDDAKYPSLSVYIPKCARGSDKAAVGSMTTHIDRERHEKRSQGRRMREF